jgi:hypothetical protein
MTATILDILHCPIFHLNHFVSDTGSCLRFQAVCTRLGTINIVSLSGYRQYHQIRLLKEAQHIPTMDVNICTLCTLCKLSLSTHKGTNPSIQNSMRFKCGNVNCHWWYLLCWLYKHYWCCCLCPERERQSSCIYWYPLSMFDLKTETQSSLLSSWSNWTTQGRLMSGMMTVMYRYHYHQKSVVSCVVTLSSSSCEW